MVANAQGWDASPIKKPTEVRKFLWMIDEALRFDGDDRVLQRISHLKIAFACRRSLAVSVWFGKSSLRVPNVPWRESLYTHTDTGHLMPTADVFLAERRHKPGHKRRIKVTGGTCVNGRAPMDVIFHIPVTEFR